MSLSLTSQAFQEGAQFPGTPGTVRIFPLHWRGHRSLRERRNWR